MASVRCAELAVTVGPRGPACCDFDDVGRLPVWLAWDTDTGIELLEDG